jgi:hypothetical protein
MASNHKLGGLSQAVGAIAEYGQMGNRLLDQQSGLVARALSAQQ